MFLKPRFFIGCLSIILAGVLAAGCGDDDKADNNNGGNNGGGSGDLSTNVEGSTQIGALSEAQKTTLCSDVNGYASAQLSNNREKTCTMVGISLSADSQPGSDTEAQTTCSDKRDDCLSSDDSFIDDDCMEDVTGSCSVTVNEYLACVRARTAQVKGIFDRIPACTEITASNVANDYFDNFRALPSECDIVKSGCPGALEDGDIFDDDLYDDYNIFQ